MQKAIHERDKKKDDHHYFSIDLEATAKAVLRKKEMSTNIRKEKTKLSWYAVDTIVHTNQENLWKNFRNNKKIIRQLVLKSIHKNQ